MGLLSYAQSCPSNFDAAGSRRHEPVLRKRIAGIPISSMRVADGPVILFQSRFASVAMDESHLRSAVSYVSLNPVRARLVSRAQEWTWSSVRAHLAGEDDRLVSVRPVLDRWPTFRDLLLEDCEEKFISLREAEGIGRPLGTAGFVTELERRLGRPIARRAPGRKAVAIPVGEQLNLLQ